MTKKDPHKAALDDRRKKMAVVEHQGRRASEPLHVMLEPEQMERYRKLQKDLNLPMREVVVLAMDGLAQQYAKLNQKQLDDVRLATELIKGVSDQMTAVGDGQFGRFHEALAEQNFIANDSVDSLRDFALSLAKRVTRLESMTQILASEAGLAP